MDYTRYWQQTLWTRFTRIIARWSRGGKREIKSVSTGADEQPEDASAREGPPRLAEGTSVAESPTAGEGLPVPMGSRAGESDAELAAWRSRPLGGCAYLYLEALQENLPEAGDEEKHEVLIAVAITEEGGRQALGFSISRSEPQSHWQQFLQSLVERGLSGVRLVISADHAGLRTAVQAVLGSVSWQRCQYHLMREAQARTDTQEINRSVASDIRAIFDAPDRQEADHQLRRAVEKYTTLAPELARWMREHLTEGLTVFAFPERHRRLIRSTSVLHPIHQEMRRRTRATRLFADEASCMRLITSVLMEINTEWANDKAYRSVTDSGNI